jgi:metallophosphoesterase (TIGR03768 family)
MCEGLHRNRSLRAALALILTLAGFMFGQEGRARAAGASQPAPTTRLQTVRPIAVPADSPPIPPSDVAEYDTLGYSAWQVGPGEDQGKKFDLMPAGYAGAPNTARLLSYFSMSDIHITDKESPAQVPYFGWHEPAGATGLMSQTYSPVMVMTTQILDAVVRTVNDLHERTPFDFGIVLGDITNNAQYNELRWFIDVLDGRFITPSSGAHSGADSVDYQQPFQAAGLNRSIPWYTTIGNHDQGWMGVANASSKIQNALVGSQILNMGVNPLLPDATESTGMYVGVVDGTTTNCVVVKGGPVSDFATTPTVVADANRRSLTTTDSTTRQFMSEFFNTTSLPAGHGFSESNITSDTACYAFEPKSELPIKIIVLDDTCKGRNPVGGVAYYANGWIDEARYAWLTSELQKGQDAGQLMIIATHIPINPQADLFDTTKAPNFYAGSYLNDAQLITTLQNYPNLLLVMAGHRHRNTVTPHPSTDPAHPENGFWEVENSSLRDFPQQFRTFDIRRNSDNTISILTTDVDPAVVDGSPARKSRGYAIANRRLFGMLALTNTASQVYNAELVKPLTPAMQEKIARYGEPIAQAQVPNKAWRDYR